MDATRPCPVCGVVVANEQALAEHFVELTVRSDGRHVMWLNRNVTLHRRAAEELVPLLRAALRGEAPDADRVRR